MKYRYILLVFVMLFSTTALAKPHVLSWSWPTQDCDAAELLLSDWNSAEIIYDVNPMPMPSDTDGPCAATGDPGGPTGSTSVVIPDSATTEIELNLMPGMTYYARIRVCYFTATNCSAWSAELEFTVPYGKPQRSTFN